MKTPRYVAGNLVFNDAGQTWAVFCVEGPNTTWMSTADLLSWHARVTGALMAMPDEWAILRVRRPIEPASIARAMVESVDLAACPRWAEITRDTQAALALADLPELMTFISIRLPDAKGNAGVRNALGAATARLSAMLSIAALPVSGPVHRQARETADGLTAPVANFLGSGMRPATEAEIEWLYASAAVRGLTTFPMSDFARSSDTVLNTARLAALGEAVLFEGGKPADSPERHDPKRHLCVETERGLSYQALGVLSSLPQAWMYPNGGGVLAHLDTLNEDIEWCLRGTPVSNIEARRIVTTKIGKLGGQFAEYDSDPAGAPDALPDAIAQLRDLVSRLNGSPQKPQCHVTFVVAVAGDSPADVEERFRRVREQLRANEFGLVRPIGQQGDLFGAMLPGAARPGVVDDFNQQMLPDDVAGCAPITGSGLGDPTGALLGQQLSNGRPVLFSPATGPSIAPPYGPMSGSGIITGKLGGGKSHAAKRMVADTVLRGGRVIVPMDRTGMGEYVRLGPALEGDGHTTQVITLEAGGRWVVDPFAMFADVEDRVRYGSGFVTLLTRTSYGDPEAVVLAKSLRRVAVRGGRLREVADDLDAIADTEPAFAEAARRMAMKIRVYSEDGGIYSVVFGDGEVASLDADYSVFHAPGLPLPSVESLKHRDDLLPEQVFALALMYLVTAVARKVAFAERHRFTLVVQDEGYALSTSPQGVELLDSLIRDGRKNAAALVFLSHDPSDLPAELVALLGWRMVFRTSRAAAAACLRLVSMDPTEANIAAIEETNRKVGECFFLDLWGRVGLIHVGQFRTPELRAAADTGLSLAASEAAGGGRRRRAGALVA